MNRIENELLKITASALFKTEYEFKKDIDYSAVLDEAEAQVVYCLVYDKVSSVIPPDEAADRLENYYRHIILNVAVDDSHAEVHKLMTENGIEYVTVKGCASASYYPEPELRCMGDVDFLVHPDNYSRAVQLAEEQGFKPNENDDESHHQALQKDLIIWEIHHSLNGLPEGKIGELCKKKLSGIYDTAVVYKKGDKRFLMTDSYHHGLVMLFHLIEHITTTGVGLRHICDWAVFVGSMTEAEFVQMYEADLKEIGLWQFARILTALSSEYLGLPEREFAKGVDKNLLNDMIEDVIKGGNFGKKDKDRYHGSMLVADKNSEGEGVAKSFFKTLNRRVRYRMPITEKQPILMPIGWIYVGLNHIKMVVKGERPSLHPTKTIKEAAKRSDLNKRYRLFERID